jgi:hypothetical protein
LSGHASSVAVSILLEDHVFVCDTYAKYSHEGVNSLNWYLHGKTDSTLVVLSDEI